MIDLARTLFVTLDIDWAIDPAIERALALLAELGLGGATTIFATHATPQLDAARDAGHELGIHPNFLPLLAGENGASPKQRLEQLRELVPEATSVRAHGLVKSGGLSAAFLEAGMRREANLFVPAQSGIALQPYEHPPGLLQLPHNFGDHAHLAGGGALTPARYLDTPGLKVLNLHPIHLYLNTDRIERYEACRPDQRDAEALARHVNHSGGGIADFLRELVSEAQARGMTFARLDSIHPEP